MFEKEAEGYVMREDVITENDKVPFDNGYGFQTVSFEDEVKKAFQDGAEFGYNKANEWHYVKDGDLPNEDVFVYLWFKGQEYPIAARRHLFKEWGRLKWCWDCKWGSGYTIEADNDRILAWKEIVLPKEIE